MKWTHRSLRSLRKGLRRQGITLAPSTIARLLDDLHFSLRTCRKKKAGIRHKDRDRQFRYLVRLRKLYRTLGLPVISVDTKKKELVGDFKNPGRCWRRRIVRCWTTTSPVGRSVGPSPTGSTTWPSTMAWSS